MSNSNKLAKIQLAGTKSGLISIANVSEPYGKGTADVVSVGVALNGEDIEWKIHIPYDNIGEVVKALIEAKDNKK